MSAILNLKASRCSAFQSVLVYHDRSAPLDPNRPSFCPENPADNSGRSGLGPFHSGRQHELPDRCAWLSDKSSYGRLMRWDKVGLNCLLNDKDEAIELRFEKHFKGVTGSGVKFGMSPDRVRKIYGDAGTMEWRAVA